MAKLEEEKQLFDSLKAGHTRKALHLVERMEELNNLYRGRSLLYWAKKFGNQEVASLLEENGAVEIVDEELIRRQRDELFEAVKENDFGKVSDLIKSGVDIDCRDDDGNTPLMWASCHGRINMVRRFLDNGADVNIRNNNNDTALIFEARGDIAWNVGKMIKMGADVNAQNNDGDAPIIIASRCGKVNMVNELVREGADVLIKNNKGNRAIDIASNGAIRACLLEAMRKRENNEPSFMPSLKSDFCK